MITTSELFGVRPPGSGRESRREADPDADGGLGKVPRQFLGIVQLPYSLRIVARSVPGGQAESRTGIRRLPKQQDAEYIFDFDREIKRIEGKK